MRMFHFLVFTHIDRRLSFLKIFLVSHDRKRNHYDKLNVNALGNLQLQLLNLFTTEFYKVDSSMLKTGPLHLSSDRNFVKFTVKVANNADFKRDS